jgi:hypothetical protein
MYTSQTQAEQEDLRRQWIHQLAQQNTFNPLKRQYIFQPMLSILLASVEYLSKIIFDVRQESRLNSGISCYHSVQSLLSSRLLSGNVKVKIYKTIILPVVLYECETWSLTLRE